MNYAEFLASKRIASEPVGFEPVGPINRKLFDFQRAVVLWSLRRGRSALFLDTGTGKSAIELEWSSHVCRHTGGDVLILTPLAVTHQMKREGAKFGIDATVCRTSGDVRPGINIANYERLHYFDPSSFKGIVIDESSCLKAYDGTMRKRITAFARALSYRLAATATPAPNDLIELTNHAEFLDVMTGKEIIAMFFTQDGNTTQKWRLKGHAREPFWRWLASWAIAMRRPSDLGFSDEGFILPPLEFVEHTVESRTIPGQLFPMPAKGIREHRLAARASLNDRVSLAAELATSDREPWVIWCNLNDESAALKKAIPEAVEVRGSDDADYKESALLGFSEGRHRVLITKASIAGHGLNWQHCADTAICGSSYSYEDQYQLIRRFYRFGQTRRVRVHLIASEAESEATASVKAKETQATEMMDQIVKHMSGFSFGRSVRDEMAYHPTKELILPDWLRVETGATA